MKALTTVLTAFLENRTSRRNLMALFRLILLLLAIVIVYSVLFHEIMEREGQSHSWVTGFYWTLTVMSTLGFGDITFESDLGRFFPSSCSSRVSCSCSCCCPSRSSSSFMHRG